MEEAWVKIAVSSEAGCDLTTSVECEWLRFAVEKDVEKLTADGTSGLDTIRIKIDREKLAAASDKTALLKIEGNDGHGAKILVKVHIDANVPCLAELVSASGNDEKNIFVQTTNYLSIEAPHFVRSEGFDVLEGYGKTLGAVKASATTTSFAPGDENAPFVEYAFALDPETFAVGDNQFPWGKDIPDNIRIATVYADCHAGLNSVKLRPVTPNIVLEKIVIHEANKPMLKSYLGAPETYRLK